MYHIRHGFKRAQASCLFSLFCVALAWMCSGFLRRMCFLRTGLCLKCNLLYET
jgi:hypothetical protein